MITPNTPTTRTFTATYPLMLDDALLWHASHTIVVTGYGASIRFELDGREATLQEVEDVRTMALSRGEFNRLADEATESDVQPIGKVRAHKLHKLLSAEGYRGDHHKLCSTVLGFEVKHLSELSEYDAGRFWRAVRRSGIEVAA